MHTFIFLLASAFFSTPLFSTPLYDTERNTSKLPVHVQKFINMNIDGHCSQSTVDGSPLKYIVDLSSEDILESKRGKFQGQYYYTLFSVCLRSICDKGSKRSPYHIEIFERKNSQKMMVTSIDCP